ncbi:MAG: pirin family protein [Pyrinomonadaceae bacterium]
MNRKIERIIKPPPIHWVGNGFRVHGILPSQVRGVQRMSPFFLLDYNSPFDFPPSKEMQGVGSHPHRGFETVTIAYKGKVEHHDSNGGGGIIGEGDVQWMTAGSGILHKEFHETAFNEAGGEFQMVQLWVNLPAREKMTDPNYQAITNGEMGRYELSNGNGEVEIIAGEFEGVKGPATTFTPINLFNLKPKKDAEFEFELPENHSASVLVIDGKAQFNESESVPQNDFVLFENEGERIKVRAEEDSVLLVMSGEPLNEPVASYGPFLMNTQEEIRRAIMDFQSGKFGYLD